MMRGSVSMIDLKIKREIVAQNRIAPEAVGKNGKEVFNLYNLSAFLPLKNIISRDFADR